MIQQEQPTALLAHFPILFIFLGPLLFIQYSCQIGRHSLTLREIVILTLQGLEYLSIWTLLLKVALAILHQEAIFSNILDYDNENGLGSMHSPEVLSDPIKNRLYLMFFLTFFSLLIHHLTNEVFHRKLIKVWESIIEEDFTEEFRKKSRSRCCIE